MVDGCIFGTASFHGENKLEVDDIFTTATGISRLVGFKWCKNGTSCNVNGVERSGWLGRIVADWVALNSFAHRA